MCKIDMVIGMAFGDEGKGCITNHLLSKSGNNYSYVCRTSGGPNAGHSIYHEDKKLVTHALPAGFIHGITSVIGAGCVINPKSLMEEIEGFEKEGFNVRDHLKIAYNAHIITDTHLAEDTANESTSQAVGSTKRGIMPAYRDKYARVGLRAKDVPELQPFLCDLTDLWYGNKLKDVRKRVLVEGAQGFYLCVDHGDYPFVTSSPPTSTYALHSLALSPHYLDRVWGVAKAYETYVGTKQFQPYGKEFMDLQRIGKEFGATTGRKRQTNWLNIDELKKAVLVNGVTDLVINKIDILRELNIWKIRDKNVIHQFDGEESFKEFIVSSLPFLPIQMVLRGKKQRINVRFSDNPRGI